MEKRDMARWIRYSPLAPAPLIAFARNMAKLRKPREEVTKAISARIQTGNDLKSTKAELAKKTGRHRDWLDLLTTWRVETIADLDAIYDGAQNGREFSGLTDRSERSTPALTVESSIRGVEMGVWYLQSLIEGLDLAVEETPSPTAIESLHPEILSRCRKLFESGDYAEAVEKSFKVVRDRLRALTTYETGSDAFGKGNLYIEGAAAPNVDEDFQNGVKFLTMAIDRFRNEKAHTADGNIRDPIRAYEYLRLSSLAMHLLDGAKKASP
jgi:uncharacterized protein (TIGR02391 family)